MTTKFPFEVSYSEVEAHPDSFVDAVFPCLESEFLEMPKGPGFVEYPAFEHGYEALKKMSRPDFGISIQAPSSRSLSKFPS